MDLETLLDELYKHHGISYLKTQKGGGTDLFIGLTRVDDIDIKLLKTLLDLSVSEYYDVTPLTYLSELTTLTYHHQLYYGVSLHFLKTLPTELERFIFTLL